MALTLSSLDIKILLSKQDINPFNLVLLDDQYVALDKDWLLSKGLKLLKYYLTKNKLLADYKKHAWDCDDFSLMFMCIVRLLHAKYCPEKNLRAYTPAFGYLSYLHKVGDWHAINFGIVKDSKGDKELIFIEPQLFDRVLLTKTELDSCNDVII